MHLSHDECRHDVQVKAAIGGKPVEYSGSVSYRCAAACDILCWDASSMLGFRGTERPSRPCHVSKTSLPCELKLRLAPPTPAGGWQHLKKDCRSMCQGLASSSQQGRHCRHVSPGHQTRLLLLRLPCTACKWHWLFDLQWCKVLVCRFAKTLHCHALHLASKNVAMCTGGDR